MAGDGKGGASAGPTSAPVQETPVLALGLAVMRAMLVIWLGVIVAGLVYFSIIGLAHH
jgi:hypothetical protein